LLFSAVISENFSKNRVIICVVAAKIWYLKKCALFIGPPCIWMLFCVKLSVVIDYSPVVHMMLCLHWLTLEIQYNYNTIGYSFNTLQPYQKVPYD